LQNLKSHPDSYRDGSEQDIVFERKKSSALF
jgi:hypothetical protein